MAKTPERKFVRVLSQAERGAQKRRKKNPWNTNFPLDISKKSPPKPKEKKPS